METTERAWRPRRQGRDQGDQRETVETRERPWRPVRDHGDKGETKETKERTWRPGRDQGETMPEISKKLLASEFGITVSEVVQVIQTRYHQGYTSMPPEDSSDANNTFVLKEA